jgi:hypothetical protein
MCNKMKSRLNNQQGAVLVMVLILMAVLTVFATAAYEVAANNQQMLAAAAGSDTALYNAEKGLHKYMWELNNDSLFFLNTALYAKTDSGTGSETYQKDGDEEGSYRVQVIIPLQNGSRVNNRAMLRSTGWDENNPERMRTIEVELLKRTFTQYGMVTNSEANENGEINYWVNGEYFYGPIHSNGTLYIGSYNPVFYGPVTYSVGVDPPGRMSSTSVFRQGCSQADPLVFPPSNDKLMAQARIGGAGDYYNGRACIMLKGSTYDIRYWDRDANTWKYNGRPYSYTASSSSSDRRDEIGTYRLTDTNTRYNSFAALRNAVPSLPLPSNGVIYVNGSTGNSEQTYESKFPRDYGNVFVSGKLDGELTIAAANDIFITRYDPVDWRHPNRWASGNYTDGLTYTNTGFSQQFSGGSWVRTNVTGAGDDMLGLVATGRIRILHFNWSSQDESENYNWGGSSSSNRIDVANRSNITIHAALYAKDISYGFEAPKVGNDKGSITLFGSISQKYRGTVGTTGDTGYTKNYSHDPRMLYTSPPHYIEPSNTGWQAMQWRETSDHLTTNP